MSAVMPQAVVDRIFAFMLTGKTGNIQLDFKEGRLLSLKVSEYCRIGRDEPAPLDREPLPAQDSIT